MRAIRLLGIANIVTLLFLCSAFGTVAAQSTKVQGIIKIPPTPPGSPRTNAIGSRPQSSRSRLLSKIPAATAHGVRWRTGRSWHFINSLGTLGGFVGPYMIGSTNGTRGNFTRGLYLVGGTLIVSAVTIVVMRLVVHLQTNQTRKATCPICRYRPCEISTSAPTEVLLIVTHSEDEH